MQFNKYQTSEEALHLDSLPDEVREEFYECLSIPFIKWLVSPDRPRACDLQRDDKGRIIVDVTKPHILEDMDYFRPVAIHFQKTGRLTDLKPNGNPNSAYGKWIIEEVRRCREGYVRETDGEWVTGNMYYFLNYFPIAQTKTVVGSNKGKRVIDFPEVWDGNYLRYHYIEQAQHGGLFNWEGGLNGAEISARGKTKSLSMAAIMSKYFTLGESDEINRAVKVMAMAYSKEYLTNDGILNKFQASLDFIATHTQFPHLLLKNSLQDMNWIMGWKNLDTGAREGTLNEASGVAVKDDVGKIRGKRLNFVIGEEFGSFSNIREIYNILLPSVREGKYAFGTVYLIGTSGEKQSDFNQATEIIYNPKGYYMYALPNVYDKPGEGRKYITFFFPEYINRKGCYDGNGNSDVTKALVEILLDRYRVKYNTTDLNTITRSIAERPITPQEALLKSKGNKFPVNELNQRLNELDVNSSEYDDVYVGELVENGDGEVVFKATEDQPIRIYPIENNMTKGALEIFCMPQKDSNGRVPAGRYICSSDPIDQDATTDSTSLYSTFVMDLFTDNVVAEYTGRKEYAEQNYEVSRLLCIFYNCKLLYENNLKGTFSYFSKLGCLHLLADTPEYLQDKELLKLGTIGNTMKGVRATKAVNNYADDLTREWLIQPETIIKKNENGEEVETTRKKLFSLRNRALIMELIRYNNYENFDRVRSFGLLMLYREQFRIAAGGDVTDSQETSSSQLAFDPFFTRILNRGKE